MKSKNMILEKLTTEEMETLKAILEKLRNDDAKDELFNEPFFMHGDNYYYISEYGEVFRSSWYADEEDFAKFNSGNVFGTREEAEIELKKREILSKLKRYSKWCWEQLQSEKIEKEAWKDNVSSKFFIRYQTKRDEVIVSSVIQHKDVNNIYFPTAENAHKAIKMIGEENLKKYVFGVEV